MPNGPTTPTAGSAMASSIGPKRSPTGSIEPSTTTTIRPRDRFRPALRAAPQPVLGQHPGASFPGVTRDLADRLEPGPLRRVDDGEPQIRDADAERVGGGE